MVVGATANQNLFLAIHEISHNLAFKDMIHNKRFAIFVNLQSEYRIVPRSR